MYNYWIDVPYIGRKLNTNEIIKVADIYKQTLIDTALSYLRSSSLNNEWLLVNTLYKKGKLITSLDKEKYSKANHSLMGFTFLYEESLKLAVLELDDSDRSYHDMLAHKVISTVIDEDLIRIAKGRLKYKLNTHVLFGNLSIIFKWCLKLSLSRLKTVEVMTSWLKSYLKAELLLPNKHGEALRLNYPVTKQELSEMLVYHDQEVEVSYYEHLIYTRYRPDYNFTFVTPRGTTVYQDSFYLRDVAIQKAIKELM